MRKVTILLAVAVFAVGAAFAVARAEEQMAGKEGNWKGELVDLACYLGKGAKGEAHKKCAQMCAAQGQPVGLLTDDGKLYLVVGSHDGDGLEQAKKLCGSMVEVSGKMLSRDGMNAIEVKSVKETKT